MLNTTAGSILRIMLHDEPTAKLQPTPLVLLQLPLPHQLKPVTAPATMDTTAMIPDMTPTALVTADMTPAAPATMDPLLQLFLL